VYFKLFINLKFILFNIYGRIFDPEGPELDRRGSLRGWDDPEGPELDRRGSLRGWDDPEGPELDRRGLTRGW